MHWLNPVLTDYFMLYSFLLFSIVNKYLKAKQWNTHSYHKVHLNIYIYIYKWLKWLSDVGIRHMLSISKYKALNTFVSDWKQTQKKLTLSI